MGVHLHKKGFKNIHETMKSLLSDMMANGFDLVYPQSLTAITSPTSTGNYPYDILGNPSTKKRWCAILKTNAQSNSKHEDEPWCIKFEWDINDSSDDDLKKTDGMLDVILGTPLQFDATTGFHTWYNAKYMPVQKRHIVAGDPKKTDPAYDYKEALGILGTTFRSKDAIYTSPNIILKGNKTNISSLSSGDVSTVYGDGTVITNYNEVQADLLAKYDGIDSNYVFEFSGTLASEIGIGENGNSNGFKVAYQSDWSKTSGNTISKNAYVNYKGNVYKAKERITDIKSWILKPLTGSSLFSSPGISATLSSFIGTTTKFLYNDKVYTPKVNFSSKYLTILPSIWGYPSGSVSGHDSYFYFGNSIVKTDVMSYGSASVNAPPAGTVITDSNAALYKLTYIGPKDLTPETAVAFDLVYAGDATTDDLTPETASYYGLELVPDGLPKYYTYVLLTNRIYEVVYAKDYTGSSSPASSSVSPSTTSAIAAEELGKFGYKYIGSYSDYQNVASGVGSSYFDIFESEDSDGYDTKLLDGDYSFPAVLRNKNKSSKMFFNRESLRLNEGSAYPMSYNLTVTSRGIAFMLYEETSDDVGNRNSWMVVQRAVDHVDGTAYDTGRSPVHCIYSIMAKQPNRPWLNEDMLRGIIDKGYKIRTMSSGGIELVEGGSYSIYVPAPEYVTLRRFVVREADVTAPYPTHTFIKNAFGTNMDYATGGFPFGVPADKHTPDYNAVINSKQQVAVSEDNKYIISFPNGLNTARFAYTHEVDMIAYTSADVISAGSEVTITAYGEETPRVYKALSSNGPNNTGMRILILKSGGGVG